MISKEAYGGKDKKTESEGSIAVKNSERGSVGVHGRQC